KFGRTCLWTCVWPNWDDDPDVRASAYPVQHAGYLDGEGVLSLKVRLGCVRKSWAQQFHLAGLRRRNELRGINGYMTIAKTADATLAATGLHGPINGI